MPKDKNKKDIYKTRSAVKYRFTSKYDIESLDMQYACPFYIFLSKYIII